MGSQGCGDRAAAGAAYADPEPLTWKPPGRFFQKLPDGGRLMGIVPLVAGKQNAVGSRIHNHSFHCGGPYIYAKAQNFGTCIYHIHSFWGAVRQIYMRSWENCRTASCITIYSELL